MYVCVCVCVCVCLCANYDWLKVSVWESKHFVHTTCIRPRTPQLCVVMSCNSLAFLPADAPGRPSSLTSYVCCCFLCILMLPAQLFPYLTLNFWWHRWMLQFKYQDPLLLMEWLNSVMKMQMLKAFVIANRIKSKLSLSSECLAKKLCRPCTSFTSHLDSLCGMVWYRPLRVKTKVAGLF